MSCFCCEVLGIGCSDSTGKWDGSGMTGRPAVGRRCGAFEGFSQRPPEGEGRVHMDVGAGAQTSYYRKEKSLGLLCENFLNVYGSESEECITLDEAATRLCVERRRIYDIVNVLESMEILVRKAKNRYTWHGFDRLPQELEALKTQIVYLEDAARILLGDSIEAYKLKTKVRRLYDIANILSSLQLIEKTHMAENRKPAFRWLGTTEGESSLQRVFGSYRAAPNERRPIALRVLLKVNRV